MTRVPLIGLAVLSVIAIDRSAIAQSKPLRMLLQSEILDVQDAPPLSIGASVRMLRVSLHRSQTVGDFRKAFQRSGLGLAVEGSAEAVAILLQQIPRESRLPYLSLTITDDTIEAVCEVLEESKLRASELHVSFNGRGDRLIEAISDDASLNRAIFYDLTVTSRVLAAFLGGQGLSTVVIGDRVRIETSRGSSRRLLRFGLSELVVYGNSSTIEFLERAAEDSALGRVRMLSVRGDTESAVLARVVEKCDGLVRFDFQSKDPTIELLWNLQKCEQLKVVVVRCHNRLTDGTAGRIHEFATRRLDVRVIVENREPPSIFSSGADVEIHKIGKEAIEWPVWSARALTLRGSHPASGVGKGSFRVLGR